MWPFGSPFHKDKRIKWLFIYLFYIELKWPPNSPLLKKGISLERQ
jgi:hypothetical protein